MTIVVRVDLTNPGQFFAACGLFELASRASEREVIARFGAGTFEVESSATLSGLIAQLSKDRLEPVAQPEGAGGGDDDEEEGSGAAAPLRIGAGMVLDWWQDPRAKDLKLWAGTMNGPRIAQAMLAAIADAAIHTERLFDHAVVVRDPENPSKKVEPFYFDARRAGNAHSRDVGFAPNDMQMETNAFPAVEVLCLIGLQRFRPAPVPNMRRVFDYTPWHEWLPISVAPAVAAGAVRVGAAGKYRFESWFRTSQKKHKAFKPARLVLEGESS